MVEMKTRVFASVLLSVLALGLLPLASGRLFVGPTDYAKVVVVESAGVDSSQPDMTLTELQVSHSDYDFVKIDLSKVPPIDEIYIVEARLGFHIDSWSGSGPGGYASVGTHYCEDNSWSNSTITWNNKPQHREETTDTWGFSYVYFGSSLGFDIEQDVEGVLRKGSTLLTEVVTWDAGSGSATLSKPSITIKYARRPVYQLSVDAVCDDPAIDISKTGYVDIWIEDEFLYGRAEEGIPDVVAAPGTYTLRYDGKCKFTQWETRGGLSVSNPTDMITQLTVNSDGELVAKCSLEWILYGEGLDVLVPSSPDSVVMFKGGESYAEKHEPLLSGYVRLLRLYIKEDPAPFIVHFYAGSDDPKKTPPVEIATPIKVEATAKGWLEVDLTPQTIKIDANTPFYASIDWIQDDKPKISETLGAASGETYKVTDGGWEKTYESAILQLLVTRTLETTVTFPTITTTTTKTSATTTRTTPRTTTSPSTPITSASATTTWTPRPTSTTTVPPKTTVTSSPSFTATSERTTSETIVPTPTVKTTTTATPAPQLPLDTASLIAILALIVVILVAIVALRRRRPKPPVGQPPLSPSAPPI